MTRSRAFGFLFFFLSSFLFFGCLNLPTAEEYYSLGMAYFELGKFEEAEKWLNRAKLLDRTLSASEYNLGRIDFELKRYKKAAKTFESILKKDPQNVMALKGAAFARLKNGDYERAEEHYKTLLKLVPESVDDGYNYALLLFKSDKYAECEEILLKYPFALEEATDSLLLLARAQKAMNKPEAVDSYDKWLAVNKDPVISFEYAQYLEKLELYAKALEQYRLALDGLTDESEEPSRPEVRFTIAKLLMIADGENPEGVTELKAAVNEGFEDFDALEELAADPRISGANQTEVRSALAEAKKLAAERKAAEEEAKRKEAEEKTKAEAEANGEDTDTEPELDEFGNPIEPAAPEVDEFGNPIEPETPEVDAFGNPVVPETGFEQTEDAFKQ